MHILVRDCDPWETPRRIAAPLYFANGELLVVLPTFFLQKWKVMNKIWMESSEPYFLYINGLIFIEYLNVWFAFYVISFAINNARLFA